MRSNAILVGLVLVMVGCNPQPTDSVDQALIARILVAEQPAAIDSLKAVYQNWESDQEVTVAGRIYADGTSPFDAKQAVFTIVDLPKPGHNHEDPGDCPFCRHELKNAKMAIVQVCDDHGKAFPTPADKLLGLKKNQDIVVTGTAKRLGETLIIRLSRLHHLSKESADELSQSLSGT